MMKTKEHTKEIPKRYVPGDTAILQTNNSQTKVLRVEVLGPAIIVLMILIPIILVIVRSLSTIVVVVVVVVVVILIFIFIILRTRGTFPVPKVTPKVLPYALYV